MDLQPFKVPVFPNVNNVPQPPTAQQAGNGSDLIARFNGLVGALSVPTETHDYNQQYLNVNANTGNDNNNGIDQPLKTIKAALAIVAKKRINGSFTIYLDGTFNESLDFSQITAINYYGQPSTLELKPGNNIETVLTLGGTYAIIPSLSPFLEIIIRPDRWAIADEIALAEVKRRMTIRGTFTNNIPADAGQNALFSLWNANVNFSYCIFDTNGSGISLFEAKDSQVFINGGQLQGFTNTYVGTCNYCRVWLENNVEGAGNSRSLSLREGTVLSQKNYTFASGNYLKDGTSYITNMDYPVLPPPV